MPKTTILAFEFDIQTVLSIIGSIELAITHPANTGPSAIIAKNTARQMATVLLNHTDALTPELIDAWKNTGILPENID